MKFLCLLLSISIFQLHSQAQKEVDYLEYHKRVIQAEELIADQSFTAALAIYQKLFNEYPYIFRRDYKVATQLAWASGDSTKAFTYLRQGILGGWKWSHIKRNKYLHNMRKDPRWNSLKTDYSQLRQHYQTSINLDLRKQIRSLSLSDRRKAILYIFRFGEKAQERYLERKFAPTNNEKMLELLDIIRQSGYPGEMLVGNDPWAQGIISRHNSISVEYCKQDTLFAYFKPVLWQAVQRGEMSNRDYAFVNEWFITVINKWQKPSFGALANINEAQLTQVNQNRKEVGLASIQTHNRLIDLQDQNGMNFYLPFWSKKIVIHP